MSDIVIRVESLSKKYTINHVQGQRSSGDGLRHALQDAAARTFHALRRGLSRKLLAESTPSDANSAASEREDFWALRDINFEVRRGEVLGIIGRNGAGKSTLLKILSRITEPTSGRIGIKGRVASLLEVGTGFHPELTGRENIYLNGAILGMPRAEIVSKFDEIVAFAEVKQFLDTPVKHYSSGMYVRLAFAVAAHLEPDILIVDEVLAVGDIEFQKKCLGKMKTVAATGGRTVLFVSHNLEAVSSLCSRSLLLRKGVLEAVGHTESVIAAYRDGLTEASEQPNDAQFRRGTGTLRIRSLYAGKRTFEPLEKLSFSIQVLHNKPEADFFLSLHIFDDQQREVLYISSASLETGALEARTQQLDIDVSSPFLKPGDYHVDAFLWNHGIIDHFPDSCRFRISNAVARNGHTARFGEGRGDCLPLVSLTCSEIQLSDAAVPSEREITPTTQP